MNDRVPKRQATSELTPEARLEKRPTIKPDTAQSSFHGDGLQNSGNGQIIVGRDVNIGNQTDKRSDCQHDLFVTDPLDDKKALKRKKGGHASGSCEWILRTTELAAWLGSAAPVDSETQPAQVLWLHGNPGTGKSIMAIFLTEELPKMISGLDGETLLYFFCDSGFNTQRTATSVVRGLLYQLLKRHQQLLDYLLPEYHARGRELFKSFDSLWDILMAMSTDQSIGRTYCIIDALDECDRESQRIILQRLEEQFGSRNDRSNVRMMVTSRPYSEIRESLQRFPNKDLASFPERRNDIDLCISEKLRHLTERKRYTNKVNEQAREILKDKAEGTFLWIGLACDELRDIPSNRAIQFLQGMPKGLHALYKKLIDVAIEQNETSSDEIQRLMSCVAVCFRPLTVLELSEACQLNQEEGDVETRVQFTHDYIESCRLLIIIQDEKVLFLHQSVRDYLVGDSSGNFIEMSEAHARLSYCCVDIIIEQFHSTDRPHTSFSEYANIEWANHARMAKSNFQVQHSQAPFFQIDSPCREHWLQNLQNLEARNFLGDKFPSGLSLFHIAAEWGILALVDYASAMGVQSSETKDFTHADHVNRMDSNGVTPLVYAAQSKYINAVTALLERGGTVTADVVGAAAGNMTNGKEVLELLFDRFGDQVPITAWTLYKAATKMKDGKEVVRLLFDRCRDQIPITIGMLEGAAEYRSGNGVMAPLLDRKHRITIPDRLIKTAAANSHNRKEVILQLLNCQRAHVNMTEETLASIAASFDRELMAMILDQWGDQMTFTDKVLTGAFENQKNRTEMLALLLDHYRGLKITL